MDSLEFMSVYALGEYAARMAMGGRKADRAGFLLSAVGLGKGE